MNIQLNYKSKFIAFKICAFGILLILLSCTKNSGDKKEIKLNTKKVSLNLEELQQFTMKCSIRAIAPIDETTCWYAGSRGQFGYTEDGGATWYIDSIQHPDQPELAFRSIAHAGRSTFLLSIASPALLYKTDDKGISWDIVYQENDTAAFYDSMAFWDDREGIAMGDPIGGCLSIIITNDGGTSWNKIPCDQLPSIIEGEAAFAASNSNISLYENHVWIVTGGKSARVFHSTDRGISWTAYETPIIQGGKMTGIFSCDFHDAQNGIIIGGDWENQEVNKGNKAMTSDGGKTWKLIADGTDPSYRSCVQYIEDNYENIIAVGLPGVSLSTNNGESWTTLSDDAYYTVREAENTLWFGGADKIARLQIGFQDTSSD